MPCCFTRRYSVAREMPRAWAAGPGCQRWRTRASSRAWRSGLANALKPQLVQLFSDAALVNRQMLEDMLKYKRLEGVDTALRQLAGKLFADGRQQVDLRGVLEAGEHPALVIRGEADAIIPASHAQGLSAEVHVLPEQAHMLQMEAAEAVNALLLDFLERH